MKAMTTRVSRINVVRIMMILIIKTNKITNKCELVHNNRMKMRKKTILL